MRPTSLALPFAFCLFSFALKSQPGCPDPQATNFSPSAMSNDGSCLYPPTSLPPVKIAELPSGLNSSSGLVRAGGRLWSHNDSDGVPKLFAIDTTTGQILQTVDLQGLAKTDWEDVATDGQHLFIGDFGNNWSGNRTDLTVYSIDLSKIPPVGDDTLDQSEVEKIPFSYPDQTDLSPDGPNTTPFDCEAMLWRNNRLHLFTKDWKALMTAHYALDPATGACEKLETFPSKSGLITAADVAADGSIALLGYDLTSYTVFAWLLWDYSGELFFSGNKRKVDLGFVPVLGQSEGLAWSAGSWQGYLSNERISQIITVPASLWRFDFSSIFKKVEAAEPADFTSKDWLVWPNPTSESVHFQPVANGAAATARLFDPTGRLVMEEETSGEVVLPAGLSSGVYRLEILRGDSRTFSKNVVVKK